jgi:hypothetical protein
MTNKEAFETIEWTELRCDQLLELQTLLNQIATIDNGNNFLKKMQLAIKRSENLLEPGISIIDFLRQLAIKERTTKQ